MNYKKEAYRASITTMIVNFSLACFKMVAGLLGGSTALVSDAVDSACDVFSSLIVMIGVKFASKSPDIDHPYGHERFECISSIVLALIIGATGAWVGSTAIHKMIVPHEITIPGALALIAALTSIIAKWWMCGYTRKCGERIGSDSLMANAANFRSDTFSSLGVFVSLIGARLGLPILDPIASVIICFLILKSAMEILLDALSKMMDSSVEGETINQMRELIVGCEGVLRLDDIKTRKFGSRYFVEVEIACDGDLNLREAHAISDKVHDEIEKTFPDAKHCLVHVNPFEEHTI